VSRVIVVTFAQPLKGLYGLLLQHPNADGSVTLESYPLNVSLFDRPTEEQAKAMADRVLIDRGYKPLDDWHTVQQRPYVPATFRAMKSTSTTD